MKRALVKLPMKPPKELVSFFADPPLAADESREDYDNLFSVLAAAVKPMDAIAWIYLADFTNLTWEIKRERWLKQRVIETARKGVVRGLLTPPSPPLLFAVQIEVEPDAEIEREVEQWARDPKARRRIDNALAERGYKQTFVLERALTTGASDIDTIDKRIATYEYRRNAILREIDRHSESMARKLDKASSEIIDGEFTEAAE